MRYIDSLSPQLRVHKKQDQLYRQGQFVLLVKLIKNPSNTYQNFLISQK